MEPMLAMKFLGETPCGMLVSEKFDGIRAIWKDEKLWSREGNEIQIPQYLRNCLPKGEALDGELWFGRGNFGRAVSAINSRYADWSGARFVCFDLFGTEGTAQQRINSLCNRAENNFLQIAKHTVCAGADHLRELFDKIKECGGEGLMLRRPMGEYVHGRTSKLQKLKKWPN